MTIPYLLPTTPQTLFFVSLSNFHSLSLRNILTEFKQTGIDFVSTTQAIDTTSSYGKMVLTFLAAIAEFERDTIVERAKAGISRAKSNGVQFGRPRVAVDVKKVIKLHHDGLGYSRIAKLMQLPRSTIYDTLQPIRKTLTALP